MGEVKIDLKDRKILDVLAVDGRASLALLARKVGVSKQVAKYRVEKLEEAGVILGYSAFVDFSKLSKNVYTVSLDLMNISEDELETWILEVRKNPNVISFVRNSGKWDASLTIFSRNSNEFNLVYDSLMGEYKDNVKGKMLVVHAETFVSRFFLEGRKDFEVVRVGGSEEILLDKFDLKLVDYLLFRGRDSSVLISEKIGGSPATIRNRISSLKKRGVIRFFRANINYDLLGLDEYRVFLFLNNSNDKVMEKVRDYLFGHSSVDIVSRFTGYADMEFRCYVSGILELNEICNKVRTRFKGEVRDVEPLRAFN